MAGFIPAIHVFAALDQVVDARVKPGHDEIKYSVPRTRCSASSAMRR